MKQLLLCVMALLVCTGCNAFAPKTPTGEVDYVKLLADLKKYEADATDVRDLYIKDPDAVNVANLVIGVLIDVEAGVEQAQAGQPVSLAQIFQTAIDKLPAALDVAVKDPVKREKIKQDIIGPIRFFLRHAV